MPTYIVWTAVVSATGSTQGQTVIEALIDRAEGWLAGELARLNVSGDTGSTILQEAVMERAIAYLYTRDQMDGTRPGSQTLDGTVTITSNIPAAIGHHIKEALRLVESYAKSVLGDPWAQTGVDPEATILREDHEMGQYQLDQSTPKEYHDL